MPLKLLAALVVLVVLGVLSSVHGYVAAEQKLHPDPSCPAEDATGPADEKACELGACANAVQPVEAARDTRRSQRRSAFQLRRRIASAWELEVEPSTQPRDS